MAAKWQREQDWYIRDFIRFVRRKDKEEREAARVVAREERRTRVILGRAKGWRWQQTRLRIFERDGYICRYCGIFCEKPECDHIVPVMRGGSNADENLATACFPCNRAKRTKLLSEWRPELCI